MSDPVFYVKAYDGTFVPAHFLSINGQYVANPNPAFDSNLHQANVLYNADGTLATEQNTNNYLIAPLNVNIGTILQNASDYALLASGAVSFDGTAGGIAPLLTQMAGDYWPNGTQDFQKAYQTDLSGTMVQNGSFVQAFTSIASWSLGFTSAILGLPEAAPELGGGLANEMAAIHAEWSSQPAIDTSGTDGNTPRNITSINAGYAMADAFASAYPDYSPLDASTIPAGASAPVIPTLGAGTPSDPFANAPPLDFATPAAIASSDAPPANAATYTQFAQYTLPDGSLETVLTGSDGSSKDVITQSDGSAASYVFAPNQSLFEKIDTNSNQQIVSTTVYVDDKSGDVVDARTYDSNNNLTSQSGETEDGVAWSLSPDATGNMSLTLDTPSGQTLAYNAAQIASSLGSTIGNLLTANGSLFDKVAANTLSGDLGTTLQQVLAQTGDFSTSLVAPGPGGGSELDAATNQAFADFGANLPGDAVSAGEGVLSSALFADAAQSLGLSGFAGVAFSSIGGSIGSTIGAVIGSDVLPVVGTFVGSFVGDVLGTLFGDLFQPQAYAEDSIYTNSAGLAYRTQGTDQSPASASMFYPLTDAVAGATNNVLGLAGAHYTLGVDMLFKYENGAVFADGAPFCGKGATQAQEQAAFIAEADRATLHMLGGGIKDSSDVVALAALGFALSKDTTSAAVASDVQIAKDYETYLGNASAINALMEAAPGSAFATGWALTLMRAEELGLTSDLYDQPGAVAVLQPGAAGSGIDQIIQIFNDGSHDKIEQEIYLNTDGTRTNFDYYVDKSFDASQSTATTTPGITERVNGALDQTDAAARTNILLNADGGSAANVVLIGLDDTTIKAAAGGATITAGNGDDLIVGGGLTRGLRVKGERSVLTLRAA